MEENIYVVPMRLPRPERVMFDMLTDDDGQSLNGEMIMLIRKEFKRRAMKLPDPLPEPKKRVKKPKELPPPADE